ncbi:Hint domain-containing homing endonuclease [Amycolatopsis sp. NPDC051128]|uniref:Hint domain-containing homing endonuclease n=1 Tax=Amycolatopsis sp. NPDC051128 TaxID=3155412 RepID=UPI0034145850
MTTYQQYQQQFVDDVIGASAQADSAENMLPYLQALLDGLPYYGDPDLESTHRGVLGTLLEVNMANNAISAQPSDSGFGYYSWYAYDGPFSGYADAFFHNRAPTTASEAVASGAQAQNAQLNAGWWQAYVLAVLTDAARQAASLSVDSGKLTMDLANMNAMFLPALTASYLATLQNAYDPTVSALRALTSAGQLAQACTELGDALSEGQFTANVNAAIAMGGDSTNAAVWFLYNLWVTLKALGSSNVDAEIQALQSAGLTVPGEVGPQAWWNGGYTTWYVPLAGPDVAGSTSGLLTAGMPESETTSFDGDPPPPPVNTNVSATNGYSQSLCFWGPLNTYQPPDTSCLGAGTGVLMADGSVKAIEDIEIGDKVMSNGGVGTIALVEKPGRLGRTLYSVNGLQAFVTSGHPFRAADGPGPRRRAVDPWNLIDAVPTMIADGVGALVAGVTLEAIGPEGQETTVVREVTSHHPDETPEGEAVYDLVVDNGARGHAVYFVGGPHTFLAVDSETADPLYDSASTLAVVAAMDAALESVHRYVNDPGTALPGILARLDPSSLRKAGGAAARLVPNRGAPRPEIPGPAYYLRDGAWDPHASALEIHLVRQYGRMFRRQCATGWRASTGRPSPNDRFTVCVQDVELLGDVPIDPGTGIDLELGVRGWSYTEDLVRRLPIRSDGKKPRWHLTPDAVVDFGRIHQQVKPAVLVGSLHLAGTFLARFRASITEETLAGVSVEHFLFDVNGKVVGRIAIDQRRVRSTDFVLERTRAKNWTTRDAWAVAIGTGRQLGNRLAALVETV